MAFKLLTAVSNAVISTVEASAVAITATANTTAKAAPTIIAKSAVAVEVSLDNVIAGLYDQQSTTIADQLAAKYLP